MNKTMQALIVLSLVLSSTAGAQSAGLELRLESHYTETLPGLPVPLRLVAVNPTSRTLPLPIVVFIHATNGADERFLGDFETGWRRKLTEAEEDDPAVDVRLSIAPRASVTADFSVRGDCAEPSFLLDPFLARPGRYALRAIAGHVNQLEDAALGQMTLAEVGQAIPDAIVSAPWTVDVETPQGVDAEAWAYVREVSEGNGWLHVSSAPNAAALRERFPASQYTLCYGALFSAEDAAGRIEFTERLRAVTPRPLMLDWLELAIADWHGGRCNRILHDPARVEAAIPECETARSLYDHLRTIATHPEVRAKSEKYFHGTMTADEIRDLARNLQAREAGTFRKVVPVLQCVKESGARLEARFGYDNPNPFTVNIAVGAMNYFTPGPKNRGQPDRFLPGVAENVFSVTVDAKRNDPARTIAWTLDEITVSTGASAVPRCKGK